SGGGPGRRCPGASNRASQSFRWPGRDPGSRRCSAAGGMVIRGHRRRSVPQSTQSSHAMKRAVRSLNMPGMRPITVDAAPSTRVQGLCRIIRMPSPTLVDRRARGAVAALFLTNGALLANLLPRYPEIKAELAMANSTYGLALAAFPAGAILAGLGAGGLVRRYGSAPSAVAGTVLTAIGLLAAASAPVTAAFAGALLLAGAADAITDVAQNAHGLRVQRRYG